MKNFFYLLPLVLFGCKSNTTAVESGDISYKVNQESVSKTLQFLASDELEGRDPGSKSMEKAVSYLEKTSKFDVYEQYCLAKAYEANGQKDKAAAINKYISDYNFNNIGYALIRSELKKKM